jgi:hypothetical protein
MLKILEKNHAVFERGSGSVRNQLKSSIRIFKKSFWIHNTDECGRGLQRTRLSEGLALCLYIVPTGGRAHGYGV